jgi:short-subunit dehydrogenase
MAEQRDQLRNSLFFLGAAGLTAWGVSRAVRGRRDFHGQTVLITGGSRGLGLAVAEEFRSRGADVVLVARDMHELALAKQHLVAQIPKGGSIDVFSCDVGDWHQVLEIIDRVQREISPIDVLVNIAGIIQVGPIESQTHEDFEHAMNVNFWGVVNTSLAALPQMIARQSGRIVNITSIGGKMAMPHLLPYTCSKFAAVGFSLGLRAEVAQHGISVTTVVPGLMRTGSYVNASFKGKQEREYSWFSLSSSLPGMTISAEKAARQIVNATSKGTAEVVLGAPAKFAAEFSGLLPGVMANILGVVNRVLPDSDDKSTRLGRDSKTAISESFLTKLGKKAGDRYNQGSKTA